MRADAAPARTAPLVGEQNPFLRYRERLDSYEPVRSGAMSDDQFVAIVSEIDDKVADVWGHGFAVTPFIDGAQLAAAARLESDLSIKVEAGNVGGSHKARHLMGVMIHHEIVRQLAGDSGVASPTGRLAIASCGNAAIGASVIARAMDRPLEVFVPVWADENVIDTLADFDATITRCERRPGESGDPCYLRFKEATAHGATAFGVQSTDTPTTIDGGRTIGWEIADQAGASAPVDAIYIQVGGGALATAVGRGLPNARLHPVQAEGCAPLARAWDRWSPDFDPDVARRPDQQLMTPWHDPHSLATGILDDVTYDWIPLLEHTRATGGHPIVAPESCIERAYELAHAHTDVAVCTTGAAGLAGLLHQPAPAGEHVALLFTGIDRT